MTPSLQTSPGTTKRYLSHVLQWEPYDFPKAGYRGLQIFPAEQFTGYGLSSSGTLQMSPALPGSNLVVTWLTSFASTPLGQHSGNLHGLPISLAIKHYQPAEEPYSTDNARISDSPPLPGILYYTYYTDYKRDYLSNIRCVQTNASIGRKPMQFSLKLFAKWMGQPNFSTFN